MTKKVHKKAPRSRPGFFNTFLFKKVIIRTNNLQALICNLGLGLVLILIAINFFLMSSTNKKVELRYDDKCAKGAICDLSLEFPEDLDGPLYVYFHFKNFFMNHRKVIFGYDMSQLTGKIVEKDKVSAFV